MGLYKNFIQILRKNDISRTPYTTSEIEDLLEQVGKNQSSVTSVATNLNAHKTATILDHPDDSVTSSKLAKNSVTTDKIADGAITTDKIADGAIPLVTKNSDGLMDSTDKNKLDDIKVIYPYSISNFTSIVSGLNTYEDFYILNDSDMDISYIQSNGDPVYRIKEETEDGDVITKILEQGKMYKGYIVNHIVSGAEWQDGLIYISKELPISDIGAIAHIASNSIFAKNIVSGAITENKLADDVTSQLHTHTNKDVLDNLTDTFYTKNDIDAMIEDLDFSGSGNTGTDTSIVPMALSSFASTSDISGAYSFPYAINEKFTIVNDLEDNVDWLIYGEDAVWNFSQTLEVGKSYLCYISEMPVSGADWNNGTIVVVGEFSNNTVDETPSYTSIGLNEFASDVYEGGFASLHITGAKYGQMYGVDSAGATENVYLSPEGTAYSASNPKTLYTTNGTLQLFDTNDNLKQSIDIDLCGNSNVRDEISGTGFIKRWSDNFPLKSTYENETGDIGLNGYDYFIYKIPEQSFAEPPKQVATNEVANLVTVGFTTVAKDNITSTDVKTAISLHYDSTSGNHIFTFKVKTGFFSNATGFAYEFSRGVYATDIRYELAEYKTTNIFIEPITISTGDYFTFTPTYSITGYDQNWAAINFASIPQFFECTVYGNTSAKIKGENEQNLLSAIVSQLLDGGGEGTTTILDLASGADVTSSIQNAVSALSMTGGTVYVNSGEYTASGTVTIPKDVTVIGIGTTKITTSATNAPVFTLACGATLKNVSIVTPLGYSSSAVLIGGEDVDYRPYSTSLENITVTGTTTTDTNGNSTAFTGNGIGVIAQHVNNSISMVYNANGNNIKVYNMQHGIYVYADGTTDFIANTYFQNMYIENCYIGIYNLGYASTFTGYCIQTKVNNLYGVYTTAGYFIGGRVFDLDLYNDNDTTRPNIGHPKIGYYFTGNSAYGYVTDPIYTEYQGKYGYDWDTRRPDNMIATIQNSWDRFRAVNETIYPLKADGTTALYSREADFNGLIDNFLAYANERFTVTTNITESDIISGSLASVFNPHKNVYEGKECLQLINRTSDDPYTITIDFGERSHIANAGMDFACVPKFVKIESWYDVYDTTHTSGDFSDDNFLEVYSDTRNRLPVVQSTWAGSGTSPCQKLRFSFADVASATGTIIALSNLYAYNLYEQSKVYMPSNGGHVYNDGKITVDPNHIFDDENEYISKKYADTKNVSFTRSLTNGTKIGTITINGTGTDLYAPTDTDINVKQSYSNMDVELPLLISNFDVDTTTVGSSSTGIANVSDLIYANPSTGSITANTLNTTTINLPEIDGRLNMGDNSAILMGNDSSLEFTDTDSYLNIQYYDKLITLEAGSNNGGTVNTGIQFYTSGTSISGYVGLKAISDFSCASANSQLGLETDNLRINTDLYVDGTSQLNGDLYASYMWATYGGIDDIVATDIQTDTLSVSNKVKLEYDSTNKCLNFNFI